MVVVGDPVASVSAGTAHTCAAFADGHVSCWGSNGRGQLGSGALAEDSNLPRVVPGLATAAEITTGRVHTCARLDDGTVSCWGANGRGQLGNGGAGMQSVVPVPVPMLGATQIVASPAGSHVCAITSTGASCWGANDAGQIGDGTTADANMPTPMLDVMAAPAEIGAGGGSGTAQGYTCLLDTAGAVQCIGEGGLGQLGTGDFASSEDAFVDVSLRR